VVDYGRIDVPYEEQVNPLAILSSLRDFRSEVLDHGWSRGGGRQMVHDLCLVDSGWQPDVAYRFTAESGIRYRPSKGYGTARHQQPWTAAGGKKAAKGKRVGHEWVMTRQTATAGIGGAGAVWLVGIHSDYWKRAVHEGLVAPPAAPGSLSIFRGDRREHFAFARQVTAERQREEFVPGRGLRVTWHAHYRENHWLDCLAGCRCAADMAGIRLLAKKKPPRSGRKATDEDRRPGSMTNAPGRSGIRTSY